MRKLTLNSQILYRALKLCEEVYDESMYGIDDLYRIKDISHSVDKNHWEGKRWLAEKFYDLYNHDAGHIYVTGGWYGMMAYQLRQKWIDPQMNITSADMDPMCEHYGWSLFPDEDISFETNDINDEIDFSKFTAIINTSCEHMEQEDLLSIIERKNPDTWICFQTNDYVELDAHINCWPNAELFAESLELDYVAYTGSLNLGDFNRHMVIGK